jgi:TetR/AcrR family transcriptional regulator, fatty acid metabolism regulator protein
MAQPRKVKTPGNTNQPNGKGKERLYPPGRIKIAKAFVSLLEQKEFGAITTAEIAKKAGVTETLIYKYFEDKRDLLHQVLKDYLEQYLVQFERDLKGIKGALNKIRKLIWGHISVYASNRVFAKILFLEVRNHLDYYESDTYQLIRAYSKILLEIVEEGVRNGEIRSDLPPKLIRQVIFGCIEHVCLTGVIFHGEISPDDLTDDLCKFIFSGIEVIKR